MRTLIVQTYYRHESNTADEKIGCYLPVDDLAVESEFRFKIYAESIGADYRMIDEPPYARYPQPAWARWAALDICIEEEYDEVVYVDADILPRLRSLGINIFEFDGVAKQTERDEGARMSWHVNAGVFKLTRRECWGVRKEIWSKPNLRWLARTGKNQDPFNNAYKKGVGRKPAFLNPVWNMTRPYHRTIDPQYPGGLWAHFIGHQKTTGNQWGHIKTDPIAKEDWQ